jgi:hypothetical protein
VACITAICLAGAQKGAAGSGARRKPSCQHEVDTLIGPAANNSNNPARLSDVIVERRIITRGPARSFDTVYRCPLQRVRK